jgi:hypothetical protein
VILSDSQQSPSPSKNFVMETGAIILIAVIASLVWLWILFEIIKSASKSTKQVQFLEIQVRLLAELLKRQGVSDDSLIEIVNLENKYFKKK